MMEGKYDDIIGLEYKGPQRHPRMSIHERAAQFAPFAALTGYDAAIVETARPTDDRRELSEEESLLFICGHYEGIDARAVQFLHAEEISIGDYVMTGGELAACVVADSVLRLVPGVLKTAESYEDESYWEGLLEYPQYTRPQIYQGLSVPDVLLSGDHEKIRAWRKAQSLEKTRLNRPDLYHEYLEKEPPDA